MAIVAARAAPQHLLPAMSGLLTKLRRRVDATAAGTQPPAGVEPVPAGPHRAGPRQRIALRRRLSDLRRAREQLIFELGALTFEQYRRNRPDGALLGTKAAEVARVDAELEAVAGAAGARRPPVELPAPGIVVPCPRCAGLVTGPARFCPTCGNPLAAAASADPATPGPESDPAPVSAHG